MSAEELESLTCTVFYTQDFVDRTFMVSHVSLYPAHWQLNPEV